jgi:hypothetical protein
MKTLAKILMRTVAALALTQATSLRAASLCSAPNTVDATKSLVITDLTVVNDARASKTGAWSFARVFGAALPGASKLGEAAYDWLDLFGSVTSVNGFAVAPRTPGPMLQNWPELADGNLDVKKAPLRLLAIVYRPDLVSAAAPAGEGRFVYGATDPLIGTKNLTVIFEFALPAGKDWQRAFADLSLKSFGPAYNQRLQALTEAFLTPTDGRSHVMQVRTNEQYFGQGWDLREFKPDQHGARLVAAPVAQTPDPSLNRADAAELIDWIQANRGAIAQGTHTVPERVLGATGFLIDDFFFWLKSVPGLDEGTRHAFAKATCNGCHGGETGTRFLHIAPRLAVEPARLSVFLKAEMASRRSALEAAVCHP